MRILHLNLDRGVPVLGHKGGSVHVRAIAGAFHSLGHAVTLVCSRLGEGNAPPPAELIELPATPGAHLGPRGAARAELEQGERRLLAHDSMLPNVILAQLAARGGGADLVYERHALLHLAGDLVARRLGVPRVLEVNAPLAEEQRLFRGLAGVAEARLRELRSWHAADLLVAVSEEMQAHLLAAGIDPARVMVAQNGVDTIRFRPDAAAGAAVRARLGIGDAPVIGFVGSFKQWHGGIELLRALAILRANWPTLRLLAVGDGPELPALRVLAEEMGLAEAVVFIGAITHAEVPAHLAAMDLVVAPYMPAPNFYFSPLKIVEALAAGKPVVAPRLGQVGALLHDGENGLTYPPGDTAALAAACARLLGAPEMRRRMGRAACAKVEEWDWRAVAARILGRAEALGPARELFG